MPTAINLPVVEANAQLEYAWLRAYNGRPSHFILRSGILIARILGAGSFVYIVDIHKPGSIERAILFKHSIAQLTLGPTFPLTGPPVQAIPDDGLEAKALRECVGANKLGLRFRMSDKHETTATFIGLTPYGYLVERKGKEEAVLRTIINKIAIDYVVIGR